MFLSLVHLREDVKKIAFLASAFSVKKCKFFSQNKKKSLECSETKEYTKIFCIFFLQGYPLKIKNNFKTFSFRTTFSFFHNHPFQAFMYKNLQKEYWYTLRIKPSGCPPPLWIRPCLDVELINIVYKTSRLPPSPSTPTLNTPLPRCSTDKHCV